MPDSSRRASLAEAVARFLATLPAPRRQDWQFELNRLLRWFGGDRLVGGLTGHEVASYMESGGAPGANITTRAEPVRAFFTYAKKEGFTDTNLVPHVRLRGPQPNQSSRRTTTTPSRPRQSLTAEGRARLQRELDTLRGERPKLAAELHLAMADKDFRENAPLDAARERQGHVEARIKELEATLSSADTTATAPVSASRASLGSRLALLDMDSNQEVQYTLVSPPEVDAAQRKISIASPLGKALLDRAVGDVVEIVVPAGVKRYRIERIGG